MKYLVALVGSFALLQAAPAQEQLPRLDALKYAFYVSADLSRLQATPIPTDVDLKHPVAVKDGDYGALLLPEAKLSADAIAKAASVVPVGQLWLRRLTPMSDGEAVSADKLRVVQVEAANGETASVVQCALGAEAKSSGETELLIYGKDSSPVLRVPMKKLQAQQQTPILMSASREYESGRITLKILGRYEASLSVTELDI